MNNDLGVLKSLNSLRQDFVLKRDLAQRVDAIQAYDECADAVQNLIEQYRQACCPDDCNTCEFLNACDLARVKA